ncbi:hypothetical protein [Rhizobium grahamii]|uniref:hypothetical protein n=1 Tax=Rhizobium grahamii TaxID=1120045 RepID=UPI00167BC1A7|nr:hypothetical protein [Rhizobium grahamii]
MNIEVFHAPRESLKCPSGAPLVFLERGMERGYPTAALIDGRRLARRSLADEPEMQLHLVPAKHQMIRRLANDPVKAKHLAIEGQRFIETKRRQPARPPRDPIQFGR